MGDPQVAVRRPEQLTLVSSSSCSISNDRHITEKFQVPTGTRGHTTFHLLQIVSRSRTRTFRPTIKLSVYIFLVRFKTDYHRRPVDSCSGGLLPADYFLNGLLKYVQSVT